jgi:hypothetical protein
VAAGGERGHKDQKMDNSVTVGAFAASVLAIAAQATRHETATERAYKALTGAVSRLAARELSMLEAAPASTGKQLAVAELIDVQQDAEKNAIMTLTNDLFNQLGQPPSAVALSERLAASAQLGQVGVANRKSTKQGWAIRVSRFMLLLTVSLIFSQILERLFSDQREYLDHIQSESLAAVQTFRPWNLMTAYNTAMISDSTNYKTIVEVANDKEKGPLASLYLYINPAIVLCKVIKDEYISRQWPWTVVLCLQLILGTLIVSLGIIKLRKDLGQVSELLQIGIVLTMPLHAVFYGSLSAVPIWLIALERCPATMAHIRPWRNSWRRFAG